MFSLPFVVAQLYVEQKSKVTQSFVDTILALPAFTTKDWQNIKYADLENEQIQQRLVKTLFDVQFNYEGSASEIVRCLEEWTNGTLLFTEFDEGTQSFLQRYYGFIAFLNFEYLKMTTQIFLLGSRFLMMACVWDIPIYYNVQKFFSHYGSLRLNENHAIAFYTAMTINKTEIGEPGKSQRTVMEWISLFDEFEGSDLPGRVQDFMGSKLEISRLSKESQKILEKIFTLYWGLKGGFIWREIDYSEAPGYETKEKKENKSTDDYYLQMLFNADEESFKNWLSTYKDAAQWLTLNRKPHEFVKKLLFILLEKVKLNDENQVVEVLNFIELLQEGGLDAVGEAILYDEQEQKFKWNDDFFVSLK